jgi:SAM-dependent methyltransferase
MKLDVGCGYMPTGDVNCDLYPKDNWHRSGVPMDTKNILNFVQCDALHLPFKNGLFDDVFCGSLIEHVKNPVGLLKELIRVSKRRVFVQCPNRFSWTAKKSFHRNFFRSLWFYQVLNNLKNDTPLWFTVNIQVLSIFPFDLAQNVKIYRLTKNFGDGLD